MLDIFFGVLAALVLLGALLETYQPGFFSETFKRNMSAMTLGMLGIVLSMLGLMLFLKLRVREGFESKDLVQASKDLLRTYKLKEICAMYTDILNKLILLEKGPPPSSVTDAQARERAEKRFQNLMQSPLLSCKQVQDIESASTLDSLFEAMVNIDKNLLVQAYETAVASRELVLQQYNQVQEAKSRKIEAFTVCTREEADERRKRREQQEKERSLERCVLPETIPQEEKERVLQTTMTLLVSNLDAHKKKFQIKESLEKLLEDYAYYKNELEKDKKAAEDGTIVNSMSS